MKKLFILIGVVLAMSMGVLAQTETKAKVTATEFDKTEAITTDRYLKRGAAIGESKKMSLSKILKEPLKFEGQTVTVEGFVVKSCKTQGCWAEVAEAADAKSIRVQMKDHAFFIPLQSAGSKARMEGKIVVKKLSKATVDHMINDDGATFKNRNADGSVDEISFEAAGIELKRTK